MLSSNADKAPMVLAAPSLASRSDSLRAYVQRGMDDRDPIRILSKNSSLLEKRTTERVRFVHRSRYSASPKISSDRGTS